LLTRGPAGPKRCSRYLVHPRRRRRLLSRRYRGACLRCRSKKSVILRRASAAAGSWKVEPLSLASTTNTAGASAGSWSLRKECPASGYSLMSWSTPRSVSSRFQPRGGAAVAAVLGAVAADDGARPAQVVQGQHIFARGSVVDAAGGVPVGGGKHQYEPAAHAKADDPDRAGAIGAVRQPGPHGVDVVEGAAPPRPDVADRRGHAAEFVAAPVQVRCDGQIPGTARATRCPLLIC